MAVADSSVASFTSPLKRARPGRWAGLLLGCSALIIAGIASLAVGTADVSPGEAIAAFVAFDDSFEHVIVRTVRLPRALIALSVGASLAVAGGIMQGLTRNPLASPTILGINAGAALAVVMALFVLEASGLSTYVWLAFAGAAAAALVVYGLGSIGPGGMTPVSLAIAGAAIAALLSSLTTAFLILDQRTLDEVRFWLAGSVAGRDIAIFAQVAPYMGVGLIVGLLLARQITTLSLGEDIARGLGQRTALVKLAAGCCVVLLAGSSVAVAGPIGFVGLVIPHLARLLVGGDYRWVLPYAAVFGAALLLTADVAARMVIRPQELPVGVMTAVVGGPFFVYLVRQRVR